MEIDYKIQSYVDKVFELWERGEDLGEAVSQAEAENALTEQQTDLVHLLAQDEIKFYRADEGR